MRRLPITLVLLTALAMAASAQAREGHGDGIAADLDARLTGTAPLRVIVQLDDEPTEARLEGLRRKAGAFPVGARLSLVNAVAARLTPGQVRELATAPGVRRIERDDPVHAFNAPGRASFGVTAARAQLPSLDGERDGSPATYSPGDLVAAVIDSGIDTGHQDLDGGKVIAFRNFVTGNPNPHDDYGHGTHVAATLAGDGSASSGTEAGVAPRAALVGVKVLDQDGLGAESGVAAGVSWAVANRGTYGIEAINLSLGSDFCSDGNDIVSQAIDAATNAGLVVVAAAGNAGPATCSIGSPGAARSAITVGAMADLSHGGFSLAHFSSRGPTVDGRVKPDVLAPGVNVNSALAGSSSGYVAEDGTSMASPFVAGLALLMRDARPGLSPAAIKSAMTRSAIDWGPGGADIDYGAGRLDAHAALRAAGVALGTPPSVPRHRGFAISLAVGGQRDIPLDIRSTSWPIAATVLRSSGLLTGLRVSLLDPSGAQVAASDVTNRQGGLSSKPARTGIYRLRLSALFSGSLRVDVSAGLAGPAPVASAVRPATPIALEPVVTTAARSVARALRKLTRRKLRRRRAFRFKATVPLAGKLAVRVVNRKGSVTIARGSHRFTKAGSKRIRVRLTKRGRRYLRRHRTRKFTVRVAFTDSSKRRALAKRKVRLKKVASR